ncbi:MAG TPA: hypothetical protein VHO07_11040 [Streptosporangiaceae bacterium]|nr:hypothetical protein [Streptosporangiaceae bacterium]
MTNATTGSDRIVPGQPPAGERGPLRARLAGPAVTHWQFTVVVLVAAVMRFIVVLGYPPILWFNDSYNYLYDAVSHVPDMIRPNGYAFFLDLLLPLHSAYPLALLQAAMGIGMGVAIYALLRHRGLPWWGAVLPTLPVLFDSYELHLEHMVTADPLFIFLVTIAVVILCWSDRPAILTMAIAGLLIGYAALVRSVGAPLLVVVLVSLLARRVGWRRLATVLVAGIVPIAAYMFWFHASTGHYALTESSGTFLYGRVSTFANCADIKPPAHLQALCDPTPTHLRPVAGEYIWADNELGHDPPTTPLWKLTLSDDTSKRFTPYVNGLTEQFAKDAILAQPVTYLRVVTAETLHTFGVNRQRDPHDYVGNGPAFQFVSGSEIGRLTPWWAGPDVPGHLAEWTRQYGTDIMARRVYAARQDLGGPELGDTRVVAPWARLLQSYQRYIYLRGTLLGIIVLIGVAGVLARWRRWGGTGLLPWLVGSLLIVLPPMTAGFSYRYVLAAAPAACLAAGLAFARRPGEKSVGALAADLRRHFGRGVAVEEE